MEQWVEDLPGKCFSALQDVIAAAIAVFLTGKHTKIWEETTEDNIMYLEGTLSR